jgi:LysM repeat protein
MTLFSKLRLVKYLPPALAALFLGLTWAVAPLRAQTEEAGDSAADHTITLTKVVEVYEFEDLKVAVDQHQVRQGDSLGRLLRARGLLPHGADAAQMMRLVRNLNPELEDVNEIRPGQILNLPAPLPAESRETADQVQVSPAVVARTLKVYERPQPSQTAAKVVVMRREETADAVLEGEAVAMGEAAGEGLLADSDSNPAGGAADDPLDFPSGNQGPLTLSPEGVVYRTVKVRRGDTMERLLRREGMDTDLIYRHLLKVTLKLNPDVKNADLILVGTEINIPAAGVYLADLSGVDPQAVREAAGLAADGKKPEQPVRRVRAAVARPESGADGKGGLKASAGRQAAKSDSKKDARGPADLPAASVETAKSSLGFIFTSLGERVSARGHLILPAGAETIDVDTALFPVVELRSGIKIVVDLESRLSQQTIATLRTHHPQYMIFRTRSGESVDMAMDRLWPLCGYYRVYKKNRTYEGGSDILLKIAADWMIWPTAEAWNSGQPLVINIAPKADGGTDPAWSAFLNDHGIKVVDMFKGNVLPGPGLSEAAELTAMSMDSGGPAALAASLAVQLGMPAKVDAQVDLGRARKEGADSGITVPVLWERGRNKVVLEFGDLSVAEAKSLRASGYKVVSAKPDTESAIDAVIAGLGVKVKNDLTLSAPAPGPKMSLTIKGRVFTVSGRDYFLTRSALPSGLARLVGEPGLTVLKY